MSTITITQNGVSETRDIERTYTGTNTMTTRSTPRNFARTSQAELEVVGHSDLNGLYLKPTAGSEWSQDGGEGRIDSSGWNDENNEEEWFLFDDDDGDPSGQGSLYNWFSYVRYTGPLESLSPTHPRIKIARAVEYLPLNR